VIITTIQDSHANWGYNYYYYDDCYNCYNDYYGRDGYYNYMYMSPGERAAYYEGLAERERMIQMERERRAYERGRGFYNYEYGYRNSRDNYRNNYEYGYSYRNNRDNYRRNEYYNNGYRR